jgi:hypothetical protein
MLINKDKEECFDFIYVLVDLKEKSRNFAKVM